MTVRSSANAAAYISILFPPVLIMYGSPVRSSSLRSGSKKSFHLSGARMLPWPRPHLKNATRRRLKMALIPHLTTRATSPLGWFCKTAFKVSMKVIFCVIVFYFMFDNSVRNFALHLWLIISADSLPSFYHVQRVWAVPLRAIFFCLVFLLCQFITFDHIKVYEPATSSSIPLEFVLVAPPLLHCSLR